MTYGKAITSEDLDLLFNNARTFYAWQDKQVSDGDIKKIYDLLKMAPTSANCQPARFIFVTGKEAKEKLRPCLADTNVEKTLSAPVTAIVITDKKFYDHLPKLFPHTDAKSWFTGPDKKAYADETAFRNGTLQGAYLIMAARALGFDCGPMSGFDPQKVKDTFFPDETEWEANFLCNIGYGDDKNLFPRSPRFEFSEACQII